MSRNKNHKRTVGRQKMPPETVFWIILIVVLTLGGTIFWLYSNHLASDEPAEVVQEIPVTADSEEPEERDWVAMIPDSHTSILLLGLDNHGLSDAIMIISYDMETFESSLISIKRDTFVSEQTWAAKDSGLDHLTFANYYGMGTEKDYHAGARLAALTIENLLGIELQAYASITFDGFIELIDLIGGVEIDVAPEFALREGGALPTGWQRLYGEQALTYARHRQNPRIPEPGSTSPDGDRVHRNQRLLKAILGQCKTMETDELLAIVDQLENKLYTNLEDWDILDLANLIYNRNPEEINTIILPGEDALIYQERIEKDTYYFLLDFEESDNILRKLGLK